MRPHLQAHPIVFEFLAIMRRTPAVPPRLRLLQWMMVRGAVHLLPDWLAQRLGLDAPEWRLRSWERRVLMSAGALFERIPVRNSPPVLAMQAHGVAGKLSIQEASRWAVSIEECILHGTGCC